MQLDVWWGEVVALTAALAGLFYGGWVIWYGAGLLWRMRISGHRDARETTFAGGVLVLGLIGVLFFGDFLSLAIDAIQLPGGGFSWTTLRLIGAELLFLIVLMDWPHRWERMKSQTPLSPSQMTEVDR